LYMGSVDFTQTKRLRATLEGCDALLAVGVPLFQIIFPDEQPLLPQDCKLVQIDANAWQIGRNYPPAVGLLGDPKAGLADLADELRRRRTAAHTEAAQARAEETAARIRATRESYWQSMQARWDA